MPQVLRGVLNSGSIPDRLKREWTHDETWVLNFLSSRPKFDTPKKVNKRILGALVEIDPTDDLNETMGYLDFTRFRLERLQDGIESVKIDSFRGSILAYAESLTIRQMVENGRYFTIAA